MELLYATVCLSLKRVRITLAHDGFTERRYQWLATVPRPRSTTVMVRNIPPMYRSDSALKDYFDRVFSEESMHTVERAYVIRKTGRLPRLAAWNSRAFHCNVMNMFMR